ncbi:ABC transporter ATP-binding protein [Tissierella praeacuta]|uniref:ABC transporter ATP-binding protein n=1 Tax=Tissierella praeacuta TaxID=43131 RepID=UPI002FDB81B6
MIEIKNLTVGTNEKKIIKDINLNIFKGEIVGLTGKSGSGKSTILKTIFGINNSNLKKYNGDIFIDGLNITDLSNREIRKIGGRKIGYIPQNPMSAFDTRYTTEKLMIEIFTDRLNISKKDAKPIAVEKLKQLGLNDTDRILNSKSNELSGGQLQRITCAILTGLNTDYILADEPTSALDFENTKMLVKELKKFKESSGILLISHNIDVLEEICEQVYVMEDGEIVENGSISSILSEPKSEFMKQIKKMRKLKDDRTWNTEKYCFRA